LFKLQAQMAGIVQNILGALYSTTVKPLESVAMMAGLREPWQRGLAGALLGAYLEQKYMPTLSRIGTQKRPFALTQAAGVTANSGLPPTMMPWWSFPLLGAMLFGGMV
jgi:hypothetical protein